MSKELALTKEVLEAHEIIPQERYKYLVDDLQTIIIQRLKRAKMEIVEAKWEIGERIEQEFEKAGEKEYKWLIERLSADLRTSGTELYRCIEFYKKFRDKGCKTFESILALLPDGDNLSWNLIKTKYLPDLPSATIPLIIPCMEIQDRWGIIKWWMTNPDKNFTITLVEKGSELRLMVKPVKEIEVSPLKEVFKDIGSHFINLKKWDVKELDSHDYGRMNRAIKQLLYKAKGDILKVKRAIDWCYSKYSDSKYQIDWTLETVIKKWPEAVKEIKPYEKYLK